VRLLHGFFDFVRLQEALDLDAERKDFRWDLTRSPPHLRLFQPLPVVVVESPDAADVTEGFVYAEWLVGRLKVLPKKGDLSNPNNWRGIMLLDAAGKITSSIISERLQKVLAREGAEAQCGFTVGRGCSDGSFALRMALQKRVPVVHIRTGAVHRSTGRREREARGRHDLGPERIEVRIRKIQATLSRPHRLRRIPQRTSLG